LNWDYTKLARHYDKRPDYSSVALDRLFHQIGLDATWSVVDMGAGTGKLTRQLCKRDCDIIALEPNAAMRQIGMDNVQGNRCHWLEATAEATGLPDAAFDLVIFGSSFNVVNTDQALQESARLLRPGSWFACLWNHRDLTDPLQQNVEEIIHSFVPDYDYGSRRQNQKAVIDGCGLFGEVRQIAARFLRKVDVLVYVDAWRSHATLARQAGDQFPDIIQAIEQQLAGMTSIEVPYHTRIWYAPRH